MTTCECGFVHGPHTFTHGLSAYSNHKCRCPICTQEHREYARRRRNMNPSPLALEVERLNAELDAADQENLMLRCRLQELEGTNT